MKNELVKEAKQICRDTYSKLNQKHTQLRSEGANVNILNEIVADMKKVIRIYNEVNEENVEELKNNAIILRDTIEVKYFKQSEEVTTPEDIVIPTSQEKKSVVIQNKEKEKCEELKQILEDIQKSLELYNNLNPQEKLTITPQDQRKDVRDIFICVYNNKHVGLFKKINWKSAYYTGWTGHDYNAGSIYVGVDSNYIGLKTTHDENHSVNRWEAPGARIELKDKDTFVANCYMQNGMSFDDMRLIMYREGKIGPYEIGKATSKEILDVLKYAFIYYQLDQNTQRQRVK